MSLWGWVVKSFPVDFPGWAGSGNENEPDTISPIVQAWQPELFLCRTLYGGWETVRAAGTQLLPMHPAEDAQDYRIRLYRPTFYNAFGRTVRALAGIVFKEPPDLVDVPNEITELYEDDIDLEGTEGNTFLLHTFTDALVTGLAGILVDMPQTREGLTLAQQQDEGLRPYWQMIRKDDIVSFRTEVLNGKTLLAQLVVRELRQQPAGAFGVKMVERLRVFRRSADGVVTAQAYERSARTARFQMVGEAVTFRGVTEIPFAPIYTGQVDFLQATPPLLDLANLNLLHYQTNSDIHHAAHIANVPIIFGKGIPADQLQIGPNRAIVIENPLDGADVRWLETQGTSIGSTRALLSDIEEQMATLGLGMLQRKSRAAQTAEKASIDRQEQDSTLAAIVSDLENGVELALSYTAQFLGMAADEGGTIEFSREFQAEPQQATRPENAGMPQNPKEPPSVRAPRNGEIEADT